MKKVKKKFFNNSFVFYVFVLMLVFNHVDVAFPVMSGSRWTDLPLADYVSRSSNFIPFKTITTNLTALFDGNLDFVLPFKKLFGHLILFLPTGIYLPFYLRKFRKLRQFILWMTVVFSGIEMVQVVVRRGGFNIDDIILNMAGALIGYGLWKTKFIQRLLR